MTKWLKSSPLYLLVLLTTSFSFAANIEAGKSKANTICAGCHGANGNSANPTWPKLAGQHAEYLNKQLHDFKSGARKDPMMQGQAAALSAEDIDNVSAYFATQSMSKGIADNLNGEQLYRSGNAQTGVVACAACHSPNGEGNALAKFPRLSNQHAPYLEKALKDFRAGKRTNDHNKMMQGVAKNLTDQEIKDVAQYIQGLN